MSSVRKAVFPAAGLGTRFLPATKAQPKEMLPLVDKPIIQYGIEEATSAGVEDIIIITGRGKNAIEDHFDVSVELETFLEARGKKELLAEIRKISNLINFSYVRQGEPLGLGHAVLVTRTLIGDAEPPARAELAWRVTVPVMGLVLMMLAVPLAKLRPRQGRFARIGFAILAYFLYSNLLATARVAARRLHMAIGPWADPHIGPSGRDGKRADAIECRRIADHATALFRVSEPGRSAMPADPGHPVVDVAKARASRDALRRLAADRHPGRMCERP